MDNSGWHMRKAGAAYALPLFPARPPAGGIASRETPPAGLQSPTQHPRYQLRAGMHVELLVQVVGMGFRGVL